LGALFPLVAAIGQDRGLQFEQIVGAPRGLPQLPPEGTWGEVINVTPRWVVLQNQVGQQFPVSVENLGEFLARWPSSVDALGPVTVVEAYGNDVGNNVVQTPHVDVFEGADQSLVIPTYYNTVLPTMAMIVNAWDVYGQSSLWNWPLFTSPSMLGAPTRLHAVGTVVNQSPLQIRLPGNVISSIIPPPGEQLTVTQLTRGELSFIKKGDYAFIVPLEVAPRGVVLSHFMLYKTITVPRFRPR
jgi:hypothetical protein